MGATKLFCERFSSSPSHFPRLPRSATPGESVGEIVCRPDVVGPYRQGLLETTDGIVELRKLEVMHSHQPNRFAAVRMNLEGGAHVPDSLLVATR